MTTSFWLVTERDGLSSIALLILSRRELIKGLYLPLWKSRRPPRWLAQRGCVCGCGCRGVGEGGGGLKGSTQWSVLFSSPCIGWTCEMISWIVIISKVHVCEWFRLQWLRCGCTGFQIADDRCTYPFCIEGKVILMNVYLRDHSSPGTKVDNFCCFALFMLRFILCSRPQIFL